MAGAAAAILLVTAGAACTILTNSNASQCKVDSDCEARGQSGQQCSAGVCVARSTASSDSGAEAEAGPVDPKWGCLGNVRWGSPDLSQKVTLHYHFVRFVGETPVTDMDILGCQRIDPECRGPVATAKTNDAGIADLEVPKYFEGFVKIEPPASYPEMMPSLFFVIPPPERSWQPDAGSNEPVHLPTTTDINLFGKLAGLQLDPALGHIFGITVDCAGKVTPGVSLKASRRDPKTWQYYTDSLGAPSSEISETTAKAEAGFINLPEGPVTIEATVPSIGKKLGSYSLLVRAGHVTFVALPPSP